MQLGGIVVCGGRSSRMGQPKAWLPFGGETMLARVVRLLGEAASPLVVVAAADQPLPPLPMDVTIACDRREGCGPLEALAVGLTALAGRCDAAYATSCDVPLLAPAFVRRMAELLGDRDAAVPSVDGFHHPLSAVYRPSVAAAAERLLAAERLRPVFLFDEVPTRFVTADELTDVDPRLDTLRNLNHPDEYHAALAQCGLAPE